MLGDAGDEVGEVAAGEVPVKRLGDLVVVVLEGVEAVDDGIAAASPAVSSGSDKSTAGRSKLKRV